MSSATTFQLFNTSFEWLSRRLALTGWMSNRKAIVAIERGEVTVNGQIIRSNIQVNKEAQIYWKDQAVQTSKLPRLWGLRKPKGIFCLTGERDDIPTLATLIKGMKKDSTSETPEVPWHYYSVVPLPVEYEGLILLSNDCQFAKALHPGNSSLETVFKVRVNGMLPIDDFQSIRSGATIENANYGPVRVDIIRRNWASAWLRMQFVEHQPDLLRSILGNYKLQISKAIRYSYGPYKLPVLSTNRLAPLPIDRELKRHITKKANHLSLVPAPGEHKFDSSQTFVAASKMFRSDAMKERLRNLLGPEIRPNREAHDLIKEADRVRASSESCGKEDGGNEKQAKGAATAAASATCSNTYEEQKNEIIEGLDVRMDDISTDKKIATNKVSSKRVFESETKGDDNEQIGFLQCKIEPMVEDQRATKFSGGSSQPARGSHAAGLFKEYRDAF